MRAARARTIGGRARRAAAGAILWLWLLPGCAFVPPLPAPEGADVRRISNPEIAELSGLVESRAHPGVFWAHNDSGDTPRFFALDASGATLNEFPIEGASHVDWEDVAIDDSGNLYLGDFGNNLNRRTDLRIYRVPEPDPWGPAEPVPVTRVLRFRFADQERHFDLTEFDYDAEALFFADGRLWIATKHRSHRTTRLYALDPGEASEETALEPLLEVELDEGPVIGLDPLGGVTAADLHPDGERLALLTYRAVHVLAWPFGGPTATPLSLLRRIDLDARRTRQTEALAWDGDALLLGNEDGTLFRIPAPLAPGADRYPPRPR